MLVIKNICKQSKQN